MEKIIGYISILFLGIIIPQSLDAQLVSLSDFQVLLEVVEDTMEVETEDNLLELFLEDNDSIDILLDIEVEMVAFITLFNIEETASLHIKVGTGEGTDDILNQIIQYDDPDSLPLGYTYLRNENEIRIGLGMYVNVGDYHGEITVTDMDGVTSLPLLFSSIEIDD